MGRRFKGGQTLQTGAGYVMDSRSEGCRLPCKEDSCSLCG